MRKLLSLNSYHYRRGGSDVVYLEHDRIFREMGWEAACMSMHHPKNIASEWNDYFVDELEFAHAKQYSMVQRIKMATKVVYSFEAKRKLECMLEAFKPDVAHAHCIYHHLSPSVLSVLKDAGVPTVMTAHDLKLACPAYKMLNESGVCEKCRSGNLLPLLKHRCIQSSLAASALVFVESGVHKSLGLYKRNLDAVVAPSRFYRAKLIEWGWPETQVRYVPNYVDVMDFEPSYEPGNYFLYFGRLSVEKGVGTLMKAAMAAGVELKIVGTGPLEETLLASNAEGAVEFLGYQSGDALWRLVRGARAVVLPSEWYENAPMSVLESYACGKPVIGADIGGISEMVIQGQTGTLFSSGSASELSERLKEYAHMDSAAIAEMGRHARAFVSDRFNKNVYVDGMLGVYSSIGAL